MLKKILGFYLLISICSTNTVVIADQFQEIVRLGCKTGDFIVQGRPFNENEAGSSSVERRYLFQEKVLQALNYERYYKNLDLYLTKEKQNVRLFALHLVTDGNAQSGGTYETGDTLYMSPSEFSKSDYEALSFCIEKNFDQIISQFSNVTITGSSFLGLMKTKSQIGVNGIARLIYTDSPIVEIYDGGWLQLLVESNGNVTLRTNYTANNKSESITVGSMVLRADGTRVIKAKARFSFQGKERKFLDFVELQSLHGSRLKNDFPLEME